MRSYVIEAWVNNSQIQRIPRIPQCMHIVCYILLCCGFVITTGRFIVLYFPGLLQCNDQVIFDLVADLLCVISCCIESYYTRDRQYLVMNKYALNTDSTLLVLPIFLKTSRNHSTQMDIWSWTTVTTINPFFCFTVCFIKIFIQYNIIENLLRCMNSCCIIKERFSNVNHTSDWFQRLATDLWSSVFF